MDQPPRDPDDLPPDDPPPDDLPEGELEETVVRDDWGEETVVREDPALVDETAVVEEHEEEVVRKPPLIWPYLLAFLLLVLGGLGAYWYFSQEDTNTVPVVVGQLEATAEASVREAGFEPESEQAESERPTGVVVEQDPEGGTELEEGETVRLTVSSGPASGDVPDVVGEQTADAVAAVEEAGFEANVTEVFSDQEAGTIAEQDPAAGEELEEGVDRGAHRLEGARAGRGSRRRRHDLVGGHRDASGRGPRGESRLGSVREGERNRAGAEPCCRRRRQGWVEGAAERGAGAR